MIQYLLLGGEDAVRDHEQGNPSGGQQHHFQGGGHHFGGGGFNINMEDILGGMFGGGERMGGGRGPKRARSVDEFFTSSEVVTLHDKESIEDFERRRISYAILFVEGGVQDDIGVFKS